MTIVLAHAEPADLLNWPVLGHLCCGAVVLVIRVLAGRRP
jgi:hypothetical protein